MDMLALSQKQKVTLFLIVLTMGFVTLAVFASSRLTQMSEQYHSSGDVSSGSISIYQTQSKILTLSSELDNLEGAQVAKAKQDISDIVEAVTNDVAFLNVLNLKRYSTELKQSIGDFQAAVNPWLELKQELGFNIDEGKLGELKKLANIIEQKIAETGMVTLNSDFQAMVKSQQNYLLQPNEENLKLFNRAMGAFESMSNVYAMLDLYEKEIEQYKATFVRVSELSKELGSVEQQLISTKMRLTQLIAAVTSELSGISSQYQLSAEKSSEQTLWSILVACIVLAVLTIAIFIMQSTSLSRSLNKTREILHNVSAGDLSKRMTLTANRNDEFNQLALSINDSCENLGELVSGVQSSGQALSGNAVELNQGLDRLAHHQSEVLGQTQVLASATEEVSVTTQEVSNSLEFVSEISRSSTESAEKGAQIIGAAIGSLEEVSTILTSAAGHIQQLEEASSKVDSVMDIINGIAEQTNLLALNAAIEAARAGEQGRGFAVVADEVRSLAVRTVDAVAEISETIDTMKKESSEVIQYIGQSETSMRTGKEKGHEAMQALRTITEKADEASHQTDVIFASIKELATTSQSMADSMTQISSAMKELEENNEQLRSISQVVEQRAGSLNSDCQRFTI
ncbi:methyl-accepting chemotaxis protein [Vibrio neptunius]|uniref:Methyl-accepting chemotaxis protein n=1 Tax=Vibrio neptunius TaxID=170651 RepID=A0ABS3A0L6_9VIBR|nr:methyl-accepting chemotaxis protein [Vibrio neptunius]MBN3492783.1 methyl-accepting chemotaxis protein [Vibrio neptunius]MBN3515280.1 methyl-accepting chemotaxis protein [Vibrio neptunius]MBN3548844.1 methyl-accepting chemotaxis protein [Vibrio neptunius]MBN3577306.1 methyl-accepting chemotaxis protein [Vibrio neptunius]MCH9870970.1 methyl-accepting chemotaxis protein [Vibrio neptunius]